MRSLIVAAIVAIVATGAFLIFTLEILKAGQLPPKPPEQKFDPEEFMRSAVPFGHYLAILAPSCDSNGTCSISIGNPSGYQFYDCALIQSRSDDGNATLKSYPSIVPHFRDSLTVHNLADFAGNLFILECKEPLEYVTYPPVGLDKAKYAPGDTVTLKGILDKSSKITILVLDPHQTDEYIPGHNTQDVYLQKELRTGPDGSISFSFRLADNAKQGRWTIQVITGDRGIGLGFEVINQ